MSLALVFLVGLLAALVILLVLALVMPMDLRFRLSRYSRVRFSMEARAFGRWGPWITLFPGETRKRFVKPQEPKRRANALKRPWPEVIAATKRLLCEVLAAISLHEISITGEFGTGDPADTGALFGMLAPLNHACGRKVDIRPNFEALCLKGQGTVVLRFTPIALAAPVLRFGWALWRPAR